MISKSHDRTQSINDPGPGTVLGNRSARNAKPGDTGGQHMCYEVIQNVTYAPKEDRKLIYIIKACTPYVSVDCAFQIFTSVSREFLKGIKIDMLNAFWNSTGFISYLLFFSETVLSPATSLMSCGGCLPSCTLQTLAWMVTFLRGSFFFLFPSKLNVFCILLPLKKVFFYLNLCHCTHTLYIVITAWTLFPEFQNVTIWKWGL